MTFHKNALETLYSTIEYITENVLDIYLIIKIHKGMILHRIAREIILTENSLEMIPSQKKSGIILL